MRKNRIITRIAATMHTADALPYNTGHPVPIQLNLQQNMDQQNNLTQPNPFTDDNALNQPANPAVVAEVSKILDRIKSASNSLKDIYYVLFDNLNGLYAVFPTIFKQLQMTVKLPTNQDAMSVVTMNNDLTQALERFKDPVYLNSFISNSSETI